MFCNNFLNLWAAQFDGMRPVNDNIIIRFIQKSIKPGERCSLGSIRYNGKSLHIVFRVGFFLHFVDLAADKAGKA